MTETTPDLSHLRRSAFGILALIFLGIGIYLSRIWSGGSPQDSDMFLYGISIRIGIVLGVVWLAFPELSRIPRWLYVFMLIGMAVVMVRPQLILIVAPIVCTIWMVGGIYRAADG